MKFAHMGDCHLGGWRHPALKELNFKSFQTAVTQCIKENVEFVLVTGDLFDNPYPPIDTLKEAFGEFRRLKEAEIPVFLIAGSHDYSVSGKTFLDVLDKAGFCKNVSLYEERNGTLILLPTLYKNVALYGYSGKKSNLEVDDLQNVKLQDAPGLFKILMLHTAIRDAIGNLPIPAVDHTKLPKVDYLALSHLHIRYHKEGRVYSGPIFPNNLAELEELGGGSFYIFNQGKIRREEIILKHVLTLSFEIHNALIATEAILTSLEREKIENKIVILRLRGILEKGKISDIDFVKIEQYLKKRGVFVFLKSTSKVHTVDAEMKFDIVDTVNLEQQIITKFEESHPSKFNTYIPILLKSLQIEKLDDEKSAVFEERVLSEVKKVLHL